MADTLGGDNADTSSNIDTPSKHGRSDQVKEKQRAADRAYAPKRQANTMLVRVIEKFKAIDAGNAFDFKPWTASVQDGNNR